MNNQEPRLSGIVQGYIMAALWTGVKESTGRPLEEFYSRDDLSAKVEALIIEDCRKFLAKVEEIEAEEQGWLEDWEDEQLGHDFWLTRNRHGAGFWDRDFGTEIQRKRLTEIAHSFGEAHLYVGDDGRLYYFNK